MSRTPMVALLLSGVMTSTVHAEDKGSLNLRTAVSEASTHSPAIQKSKSISDETAWKRVETYSKFLPSVSISSQYLTSHQYMYTDISFGGAPASIPNIVPTSLTTVTAQLPLFDGFAGTNRYLSAKRFEAAANKEFDWTRFQVERDVVLAFYRALAAKVLTEVAEQNVKTLEDHLNDVNQFKKAGLSTNFDVLRVEVQVSEAKSELLNSQDNIAITKNRLAQVLGEDNEARDLSGQLPILNADMVKNIDTASVDHRSDLAALRERAEGFDDLESSASRYWVPKISLFGQYQYYNNRNEGFDDWNRYRDAHQIGVALTWNIFDGMISIARSKESVEQRFQAEKTLRMSELKAKQDLDLWKRKFVYFCSVYKSRVSDVEKSTESVRLAKQGRCAGSRTNTDLLDAESELFRAKAGLVNSQIGAIEALVNLELASGMKIYDFN